MTPRLRLRLALLAPFALACVKPGSPLTAASAIALGAGAWSPVAAFKGQTPKTPSWPESLKRLAIALLSAASLAGTLALTAWVVGDTWVFGAVVCAVLIAIPAVLRSRTITVLALVTSGIAASLLALFGLHAWVLALLLSAGFVMSLSPEYAPLPTARSRSFLLAALVLFCVGNAYHQLLDPLELFTLVVFGLAVSALSSS